MEYLLLTAGFVLLIFSGKFLIQGSVSLAIRFKISKLVIGMTVVAFGTSAPELFVSLMAAINGHPEISIGNVVGSNIANIALILGLTAVILPIPINRNVIKVDWPVMMLATVLFYLVILNRKINTAEGLIFLFLLILYIYVSIYSSRKKNEQSEVTVSNLSILKSIFLILLSSGGLAFGSFLLVNNAAEIAKDLGIGERIISITLIAIGTSVPELVTSISAAIKKEMDISIGNIIGSNIFNILGILGVTSIIKNIEIPELTITFDIYWVLGITLLLFLFIIPFRTEKITRLEGILLLIVYSVYLFLLLK